MGDKQEQRKVLLLTQATGNPITLAHQTADPSAIPWMVDGGVRERERERERAVSYTHLTLPTRFAV